MTVQEYDKHCEAVVNAFKEYCKGENVDFDTKEMSIIADYFDVKLPNSFYNNFITTYNKFSFRAFGCFKSIQNCIDRLVKKGEKLWNIRF